MSLLDLIGRVSLDASGWQRGLSQVRQTSLTATNQMGQELKGRLAAIFSTTAIVTAGKAIIDYASNIKDLASRLGIGTDKLQSWGYAAEQTGAKVEDITKAIEKMADAQAEAVENPKGTMAKAFQELGISANELKSLGVEDMFRRVARAVNEGSQSAAAMAAQVDILGKGAGKLRNAFKEGLGEFEDRAKAIGILIDENTIDLLEKYGDKWADAGKRIKATGAEGAAFFVQMHEGIYGTIRILNEYIQAEALLRMNSPFGGGERSRAIRIDRDARIEGIRRQAEEDMFGGDKKRMRFRTTDRPPGGSADEIEAMSRSNRRRAWIERVNFERELEKFVQDFFSASDSEAEKITERFGKESGMRRESDTLLSVGNFLGSSQDPTAAPRELKDEVAKQTEVIREQLRELQRIQISLAQGLILPI